MDVPSNVRRDHSSTDDLAGLEALYDTRCDRVRRETDAKLSVSNEYLSCRFCCIIEPTGFIMNKHTYMVLYLYYSKQRAQLGQRR